MITKQITYKGVDLIVSDDGRVWNAKTRHEISQNLNKYNGYYAVVVSQKPNKIREYVHRLVCTAFLSNPDNKRDVNHKNGIKTDNRVENLEWCTHSENQKHAFRTGIHPISRNTPVYCAETNTVYPSMIKASLAIGKSLHYVRHVIKGYFKCPKYHFTLVE